MERDTDSCTSLRFWLFTGLAELKSHVNKANLNSWENECTVVIAALFIKEDLFAFYKSGIMFTYAFFMTDTYIYYRFTKQVTESRL